VRVSKAESNAGDVIDALKQLSVGADETTLRRLAARQK